MGASALVLAAATDLAPVPYPAQAPATRPRLVMSRHLWLPQLALFAWRDTTSFSFTVARSAVSLVTVDVIFAIVARSLAVALDRFAMESTVSCWRYPLSGFAVALCADP